MQHMQLQRIRKIIPATLLGLATLSVVGCVSVIAARAVFHLNLIAPPQCYATQEAVSNAIFDNLNRKLPEYGAWSVISGTTRSELDDEQRKITHLRQWVRTIHDVCYRSGYDGWLDYYQHHLNGAYRELPREQNYHTVQPHVPVPPDVNHVL
jgi:hypothetical protein